MKKKLALLLSLGLCVSTMTITASADEEKTYKIGVASSWSTTLWMQPTMVSWKA